MYRILTAKSSNRVGYYYCRRGCKSMTRCADADRLRDLPATKPEVIREPVRLPDGSTETVADQWARLAQDIKDRRAMLTGVLNAYYRPEWESVRFTTGDLETPDAILRALDAA